MSDFALDPVWGSMVPEEVNPSPESSPGSSSKPPTDELIEEIRPESPSVDGSDSLSTSDSNTDQHDPQSTEDDSSIDIDELQDQEDPQSTSPPSSYYHVSQSSSIDSEWSRLSSVPSHHGDGQLYSSRIDLISNHYLDSSIPQSSSTSPVTKLPVQTAEDQVFISQPFREASQEAQRPPPVVSDGNISEPSSISDTSSGLHPSEEYYQSQHGETHKEDPQHQHNGEDGDGDGGDDDDQLSRRSYADSMMTSSQSSTARTLFDSFNNNGSESASRAGGGRTMSKNVYDFHQHQHPHHAGTARLNPHLDPSLSSLLDITSSEDGEPPVTTAAKSGLARQYSDGNLQRLVQSHEQGAGHPHHRNHHHHLGHHHHGRAYDGPPAGMDNSNPTTGPPHYVQMYPHDAPAPGYPDGVSVVGYSYATDDQHFQTTQPPPPQQGYYPYHVHPHHMVDPHASFGPGPGVGPSGHPPEGYARSHYSGHPAPGHHQSGGMHGYYNPPPPPHMVPPHPQGYPQGYPYPPQHYQYSDADHEGYPHGDPRYPYDPSARHLHGSEDARLGPTPPLPASTSHTSRLYVVPGDVQRPPTRSVGSAGASSFFDDDRDLSPDEDSHDPLRASHSSGLSAKQQSQGSAPTAKGTSPSSSSQQSVEAPTLFTRIYTAAEPFIVPAMFALTSVAIAVMAFGISRRTTGGGGSGGSSGSSNT